MNSEKFLNLTFNFDLKVLYNHHQIKKCTQKCLLPAEKFPCDVIPGSLCICTVNGDDFVCYLYPFENKFPLNYCAIDTCVSVQNTENKTPTGSHLLTNVKIVPSEVKPFIELSAKVVLNNSIFEKFRDVNPSQLEQTLKTSLELYSVPIGSKIEVYDFLKSFGIDSIQILSGTCESEVGCVTSETKFTLENVQYFGNGSSKEVEEIAGMSSFIHQLTAIAKECTLREKFLCASLKPSNNVLIVGPTGCGKTSLCQNFIIKNNCNVFEIQSSEILKPLPGETEEELRLLFGNVERFVNDFQPTELTVILIENIDLLCPADIKSSADRSHVARICGQFVSLLDELHQTQRGILVIGTTSNLELVNSIIRRPGRFENEILIHAPSEKQREEILSLLIRKEFQMQENNLEAVAKWIASKTPGYVGADLALLVHHVIRQRCGNRLNSKEAFVEYFTNSLKSIKPTSLRGTDVSVITSDLTFDDIGGMDTLKKSLQTSVLSPCRNPEAFRRFGLNPPKGILLYGPPGCAKTMFAKCLANEANMTFISTSGAEVYSPYVGDAEKFILKIFNTARKNAPCLIFFDEIDALVGSRQSKSSSSDVQTRVLSTLLTEMDGIGVKVQSVDAPPNSQILIIGATNRPDVLDNALMRPGRFDRLIHVPAPDYTSRLNILRTYEKKMPFATDVNIEDIARRTEYFSGADLCNLCNEAALFAITRNLDADTISRSDFEIVMETINPSLTVDQINWYRNFEKQHICI